MKFKTNLKRFLSMSRQTGGFTLVELIVVIAILAILAGVAIPAYSGYITKANEAADQQLLSAVNRAFTSACIEEGYNPFDLPAVPVLDTETVAVSLNGDDVFASTFAAYFAGNENSEFKVFVNKDISYSKTKGMFLAYDDESRVAISYGGTTLYVSPEYVAALQNSTFGKEMGMENLLNQLDKVTDIASGMSGGALAAVLTGETFTDTALGIMNIDTTNMDAAQKEAALDAEAERLAREALAKEGKTNPTADELNAAKSKVSANAAVLFTAQQTAQMSKEEANQLLTSASVDSIKNSMNNDATAGQGMAQAALVCGMYTAYVNSPGYEGSKTVDAASVMNALDDPAFKTYMGTQQGQADLAGYLASLNMVNSSTGDASATEQLLVNGFADPDLLAAMNGIMNGN